VAPAAAGTSSAAGEGPFQRHQLPGAPLAGVDQDRRLADVEAEALDGRVEEVVTHVGDYPGDDLVASAGRPEAGGVPGGGQPRCPSRRNCAACSAWSRHTITVKNDGFLSRRPETAARNMARAIPPSVQRTSGSSVRLPAKLTLASVIVLPLASCLAGRSALLALV
jgi:hypothetical protein